jgi:ribonuclease BN (tRNA processing enzyme)
VTFDIGSSIASCTTALKSNVVFVSHGHVDHLMSLFSHARTRMMTKNKGTTYFVPEGVRPDVERLRGAVAALDRGNDGSGGSDAEDSIDGITIVGVNYDSVIDVTQFVTKRKGGSTATVSDEGVFVRCFPVAHVPSDAAGNPRSVGYTLETRSRTPGLLPEYQALPKQQLKALREANVPITDPELHTHVLVTYFGDTAAEGITRRSSVQPPQHPNLHLAFAATLILLEVTYIGPTTDAKALALASSRCHVHSSSLSAIFPHALRDDQRLVFVHPSSRYGSSGRVKAILREFVPDYLRESVGVVNNEWWQASGKGGDMTDEDDDVDAGGAVYWM